MKRMQKGVTALLCALLFAGLPPAVASAAGIREGTPAFALNETVVTFAGYEWYVVGDGTSGASPQYGHLTLLSKSSFGESAFRRGSATQDDPSWTQYADDGMYYEGSFTHPGDYNNSTLMRVMNDLAGALSPKEAELITPFNLDGISGAAVTGQKLWPLAKDEIDSMSSVPGGPHSPYFWLRSGFLSWPFSSVWLGGISGAQSVDSWFVAVRPALHLNMASVLFTSDAGGASSKASATVGSGLIGTSAPTQNLKFTMRSSAQTLVVLATPEQSTQRGENLSFSYQNATTGDGQYLSCVLLDEHGALKYYGKLADSSADSGALSVPLTGVSDGTYTLELFSEQANGDTDTDFASTPTAMTVTVSGGIGTVSSFGGAVLAEGREIELRVNATHVQWRYVGETAWNDLVTLAALTGADGHDGADGREVELRVDGGYIQWRYTGGSWTNLMAVSVVTGPQGEQGPAGAQGPKGTQGPAGATGAAGANGRDGTDGSNGADGRDGRDGADGLNGKDGSNGANGRDGQNGKDGKGILSIIKTGSEGNVDTYTISFTDGTSTAFTITNGEDGVGVASAAFNENGDLAFTRTDGAQINLGPLPGAALAAGGDKGGSGAAVPVGLGAASGAAAAGLLYWLLPLLRKKVRP